MKLNLLMVITAIVALIFGLAFLLIPNVSVALYGNKLDVLGAFMTRYFGSALVGLAFLAFLNRNTASKSIQGGFFVTMILGLVVALWNALAGPEGHNALVWLNVVIYLLLALGFGYFYFMKKE